MKRLLLGVVVLIVLVLSFYLIFRTRSPKEPVAVVDGERIEQSDFRTRFKKYLETTGQRDNIVIRKRVLDNMINERLIYADIHEQGIDRYPDVVDQMATITDEALALRYAKYLVVDSMAVSEQDLMEEFARYKLRVHARYLYARTEDEALSLKMRIDKGATFDDLAKEVFRDPGLAGNGGDLGTFGWGEMEPALEAVAFSQPVGSVSEPVHLKVGYALVKVEKRFDAMPLASESDYTNVREKLADAIVKRRLLNFAQTAGDSIERQLHPVFSEDGVLLALRYYDSLVGPKKRTFAAEPLLPVPIDSSEFMSFGSEKWTLKDFFTKLRHTTEHERRYLRSPDDVKKYALGLAAREIILRRAREKGFDRDTSVEKQIQRTEDEFLLRRWSSTVTDTVGQHGWDSLVLLKYYQENLSQFADPPQVNVAEILVRTKDEADAVRRQVDRGMNFADLARKKSIRLWAAKNGGELGFGARSNYGVLGDTFFNAKTGALLGPLFVDPYYGVFKIVAKREGHAQPFSEARENVIAGVALLRKQEVMREAVGSLRKRARVSVNESVLGNISVQ